jgi:hypothetical protein
MSYFCVFVACHPRRSPGFHEINAQFASRMGLREPSPLECAVAEKHRVLPVFGHNRPHVSPLECAVQSSPVTVDSKWITKKLTPLECALTKNKGVLQAKCSSLSSCPSRCSDLATFRPSDVQSPIFRTLFQVPYPASPLSAALTKTPGVWGYSSHSGTRHFPTFGPSDVPSLRRRLIQA